MQILTNVELSPIYATLIPNVSILQDQVESATHEPSGVHCILVMIRQEQPCEGTYECKCNDGYKGDGYQCENIDECTDRPDYTCGTHSTCVDIVGSFNCICNMGYAGNVTCRDIDECIDESHNCAGDAVCVNNDGSYECNCNEGFGRCADLDECALETDECHGKATCKNTLGTYDCDCNDGYEGDGRQCSDKNECVNGENNCDANGICINKEGSFTDAHDILINNGSRIVYYQSADLLAEGDRTVLIYRVGL